MQYTYIGSLVKTDVYMRLCMQYSLSFAVQIIIAKTNPRKDMEIKRLLPNIS